VHIGACELGKVIDREARSGASRTASGGRLGRGWRFCHHNFGDGGLLARLVRLVGLVRIVLLGFLDFG
jgi:hypothetical protein